MGLGTSQRRKGRASLRAGRLGVATFVVFLALGVSAPSALAAGWSSYVNYGWVPRLANAYSGYDYIQAGAAEAYDHPWGCANLMDSTTGWLWSSMYCAGTNQTAYTPWINPRWVQAIAWNDSQSGQYMSAWAYYAYSHA